MSNLFMFGAFAGITIVFFAHNWLMSSRQQRLERKLDDLKAVKQPGSDRSDR